MEDYALVRLFDTSEKYICEHIYALPSDDLHLRFGYTPSRSMIAGYVHSSLSTVNTRQHADFWFGIKMKKELVATIHVSIRDDVAEFAFTTDTNHRGKKLGQLLFARGYQLVTEYSIKKIVMQCLSVNAPMRHIASKFGLNVVRNGSETDASLTIQYPFPIEKLESIKITIEDK